MSAPRIIIFTTFAPPTSLQQHKRVLTAAQRHAEVVKFSRSFMAYCGSDDRNKILIFAHPVGSVAPVAKKTLKQRLYQR